jgi:hypothetical protein
MRTIQAGVDAFATAMDQVGKAELRAEFLVEECPAPARLAPQALALSAEATEMSGLEASGRFVLLHDADGVDEWEGTFRAVVFIRAAIEPDLAVDPMLHEVCWSWVEEAIGEAAAPLRLLGGTVTSTSSTSFGSLIERPAQTMVEVRASWTPAANDEASPESMMDRHVLAWGCLLAKAAGLMPLPPGVRQVGTRRST